MNLTGLVAVLIAIQLALTLLDAWDAFAHRGPVRWRSVVFLGAVALLYLSIQFAGLRLLPDASKLLADSRLFLSPAGGQAPPTLSGAGACVVSVFLFYLAGLWDYVVHRFLSHHRGLWFTHEYHHLPRHVSILMPGIAAAPFAFLPRALTLVLTGASAYAVFRLAGLPLWDLHPVLPVLLLVMTVGLSSHSSWLRRYDGVHRVMRCLALTTPQEHLHHHTVEMNVNYGNFTTLWDRLFGTYLDPLQNTAQPELGLPYDQDFVGTLTFGYVKIPTKWRERFQLARFCNIRRAANVVSLAPLQPTSRRSYDRMADQGG